MIAQSEMLDQIMPVMESAFDPAFGEAWNRIQVASALAMPSTHALIVDHQGKQICGKPTAKAVGFLLSRHAADEEELLLIAVLPEYRTRGIGKIMFNYLFQNAKQRGATRVFLEMRRGNPAEHLYQKLGFNPIGERPDYYRMSNGDRLDAITFACSL